MEEMLSNEKVKCYFFFQHKYSNIEKRNCMFFLEVIQFLLWLDFASKFQQICSATKSSMPKVYENDDDDEDIEESLLKYDFCPCWCFLSLDN